MHTVKLIANVQYVSLGDEFISVQDIATVINIVCSFYIRIFHSIIYNVDRGVLRAKLDIVINLSSANHAYLKTHYLARKIPHVACSTPRSTTLYMLWKLLAYKKRKAPVKSTNQHPAFYGPDAFPVTQLTVSKHWREELSHSMDLLTARSPGLPALYWPPKAHGYLVLGLVLVLELGSGTCGPSSGSGHAISSGKLTGSGCSRSEHRRAI